MNERRSKVSNIGTHYIKLHVFMGFFVTHSISIYQNSHTFIIVVDRAKATSIIPNQSVVETVCE